jgi:hypothetical protein
MAVARRPLYTQTALGVDIIKQYLGPEQIELKVTVQIPGSWFGGSAQGALTASERRDYYEAQAVEFAAVREFGRRKRQRFRVGSEEEGEEEGEGEAGEEEEGEGE